MGRKSKPEIIRRQPGPGAGNGNIILIITECNSEIQFFTIGLKVSEGSHFGYQGQGDRIWVA